MTPRELAEMVGLEVITIPNESASIIDVYTSDLLSDVMANAQEFSALITIQSHKNTVAVATITGITAIILANNRPCDNEMVFAAQQEEIALLRSNDTQYTLSWKIHQVLDRDSVS